MASIHRKSGASGKVSPFWQAKFRSADGSTVWRSTKQTDSRKAIEVARKCEKAARLAANSELTQSASIRLLDELMEVTIGEHLDVQSVETYIEQWLRSKKATGTSSGTLFRYEPVLEGFLQSLSEKRRRTSVASITALEVERFRNSELEGEKRQVQRTSQLKCCVQSSIQRGGAAFVQAIRLRPSKCFPRRARSGSHSPKIK